MNSVSAHADREIKPIDRTRGLLLVIRLFLGRLTVIVLAFSVAIWVLSSSIQEISSPEPTVAAIELSLESLIGVESLLLAQENSIRERAMRVEPSHIIHLDGWPFLIGLPASVVLESNVQEWAQLLSAEAAQSIYVSGPEVILSEKATSQDSWFTVSGFFLRVWSFWNMDTYEVASIFARVSFLVSAILFPLFAIAGVGAGRFFTCGLIILISGFPTMIVFGAGLVCWYIVAPNGSGFSAMMRDLSYAPLWQGFSSGLLMSCAGLAWLLFLYIFRWSSDRFQLRSH